MVVSFMQAWRAVEPTGHAQRLGERREKEIIDAFERRARRVRLWAACDDPLKACLEHVLGYGGSASVRCSHRPERSRTEVLACVGSLGQRSVRAKEEREGGDGHANAHIRSGAACDAHGGGVRVLEMVSDKGDGARQDDGEKVVLAALALWRLDPEHPGVFPCHEAGRIVRRENEKGGVGVCVEEVGSSEGGEGADRDASRDVSDRGAARSVVGVGGGGVGIGSGLDERLDEVWEIRGWGGQDLVAVFPVQGWGEALGGWPTVGER